MTVIERARAELERCRVDNEDGYTVEVDGEGSIKAALDLAEQLLEAADACYNLLLSRDKCERGACRTRDFAHAEMHRTEYKVRPRVRAAIAAAKGEEVQA